MTLKRLRDLPIGALVKDEDSKYYGKPIVWKIADKDHIDYPKNSVTLISDKILCLKAFDAREASNKYKDRRSNGNNYYKYSNLLQWLNSDKENWYKAQHETDAPPSSSNVSSNYNPYDTERGFLYNFSKKFKEAMMETSLKTVRVYEDGGGSEKVVSKVFLASTTEVGLANERVEAEGIKFPIFDNNNSRLAYPSQEAVYYSTFKSNNLNSSNPWYWWLRTPKIDYPSTMRNVKVDGSLYWETSNSAFGGGVRPLCNIKDEILVKDEKINGVYEIVWNEPPNKPESFTLPEKAISRTETEISWTKSTDPENDPISYRLERSLDGGNFVERYKGSFTRYKDIIEDKGHTSVVYRVTAIDSYGNQSESLTSASLPVSDNTIPVIETSSTNLGKRTTAYSVSYKVVDPDSGQTWTVTESLDGKVLKTFDAKVGTSYTSKLSASDWQKVLNGKHILKIEVVDSEQGKDVKEISFEKDVRKLDFELGKAGLQGIDKMPERAILSMGATIPSGASIKVEITNNGLDAKPVWQDCTTQVLGGDKIFFSNKSKTATKWAVNIRVTADKKTATEVLSVSSIGGFYD